MDFYNGDSCCYMDCIGIKLFLFYSSIFSPIIIINTSHTTWFELCYPIKLKE
jgi:hypothetical protein